MNLHTGDREQRLAERLRDGDSAAMRDFYAQMGGWLMAVCVRYVGNEDDAKDVLQETLIRLFTHAADFTYRGRGSLKAWATRLAVNQSLTFLRERKREGWLETTDRLPDTTDDEPQTEGVPEEVLQRLIAALPDGYRTVFCLYVFEHLPHDEIARRLGIKRDTSASQFHRAKALLAKQITEYRQQTDRQR